MSTIKHKNTLIAFGILATSLVVAFFITSNSSANIENLNFPIAELGNCTDKDRCKQYCDQKENFDRCLNFAERNNLIASTELKEARKAAKAIQQEEGPGRCSTKETCENYCNDINHINECLAFAEKHGIMEADELQEARKMAQALKQGAKLPGGCINKQACEAYCQIDAHFDECIAFAETAGFMSPEELEIVKKTGGKGPGGCRGEKECRNYCDNENHLDECIAFAQKHGLMDPKEAEMIRKTGGKGPGGCRGEIQCKTYCDNLEHMEECVNFALDIGEISPEEAARMKKMAERGFHRGPGECRGKEECEAFCNNPDNMEQCVSFAVEIGEMTLDEAEQIKKMGMGLMEGGPGGCKNKNECETYCNDPAHQDICMDFAVKRGFMSQEERDGARNFHESLRQGGPGGCQNEKECKDFCSNPEYAEECRSFSEEHSINHGQENFRQPSQDSGYRNSCEGLSPEECRRVICADPANADKCQNAPPPEYKEEFYKENYEHPNTQTYPEPPPPDYQKEFYEQQHINEPVHTEEYYKEPLRTDGYYQEPTNYTPPPTHDQPPIYDQSTTYIEGNLLNAAKNLFNKLANLLNK